MSHGVATIVRCADLVRHVYSTVESVERQAGGGGEVVLVTDESTPPAAQEWLREVARRRGFVVARAASARPGAVKNAGIRATRSPYVLCVDAGDLLDPRCHQMLAARLESDPAVDVATSWIHVVGPGADARITAPDGCDLDALIGDAEAIPGVSMFRRTAWESLGGFDESLPSLDHYDFWLRLLQAGRRPALVEYPLLLRVLREDALYRRAWERERHVEAIGRIVDRHATLFARDPARALYNRERLLQQLGDGYRHLVGRRDSAIQELERLKMCAADLRRALPESDRDAVDLGDLKRTTPVARDWGYERGRPIDRYYIERFLEAHAADISGVVLEVQEPDYTQRFGGARVTRSEVVDLDPSNSRATLISDLRNAANIASETYDCVILTQTLHVVDDMRAVLAECRRILKPDGVLLVTLPAASRVCLEYGRDGDFWRVTEAGARKLFSELFPSGALDVRAHGNVLVNTAFLYGLACHELTEAEFEEVDPYFPLVVTVRAVKPAASARTAARATGTDASRARTGARAAILLYHRVADLSSDVHRLATRPDEFRTQMEHLAREYRPTPLVDLVAAAREDRIEPRSVAVTFDDGYVDNYVDASPILSALGVPATFFVTTDRLGAQYEFWWDVLEHILLAPESRPPSELRIELPDGPRTFPTATADQRHAAHTAIYHAIVATPADARDETIDTLTEWSGRKAPLDAPHRRMNPDEMRSLASRDGHTLGAHTAKHLMLPRQPIDVQREEIDRSRRDLEALVARTIRSFAYPFGAFSDGTVGAVASSSMDVAVTCEVRLVGAGVNPLTLPRFEVTQRRPADFASWMRGLFSGS